MVLFIWGRWHIRLISYLVMLPLNLTVSSQQALPSSSVFLVTCLVFVWYRMEPKDFCMIGMCSTTGPHLQPLSISSRDSLMIFKMISYKETEEMNESYGFIIYYSLGFRTITPNFNLKFVRHLLFKVHYSSPLLLCTFCRGECSRKLWCTTKNEGLVCWWKSFHKMLFSCRHSLRVTTSTGKNDLTTPSNIFQWMA